MMRLKIAETILLRILRDLIEFCSNLVLKFEFDFYLRRHRCFFKIISTLFRPSVFARSQLSL
jgi:hypothetical protein